MTEKQESVARCGEPGFMSATSDKQGEFWDGEPWDDPTRRVVLNLEFMRDKWTKVMIITGRSVAATSLAFLIYEVVAKFSFAQDYFLRRQNLEIINTCVATLCLAALVGVGLAFGVRVFRAARSGKQWLPRQKRVVGFVAVQLTLQLINAGFYLAPNAHLLRFSCSWFLLPINIYGFIRWTCWMSLFSMLVGQAYSLLPARFVLEHPLFRRLLKSRVIGHGWKPPKGADGMMVYDLPLSVYVLPLLLLWVPGQVIVVLLLLRLAGVIGGQPACTSIYDNGCHPLGADFSQDCTQWEWLCQLNSKARRYYYGITGALAGWMLLLLGIYFVLMYLARRELAKLPYTRFRVANLGLRHQVSVQSVMAVIFVLDIACLWFFKLGTCNGFVLLWLGLLPMQLGQSTVTVVNAIIAIPIEPSPQQLRHHQRLQRIVWREGADGGASQGAALSAASRGKLVEGKEGEKAGLGAAAIVDLEPMFCFETALKSLYWSNLLYYIQEEEEGQPWSVEVAMGLYGLTHHELHWEKALDTKCLLAWREGAEGQGTIVLAFRGTASMANVLADIKVWRVAHPPVRGFYWLATCPMVHKGFLESYTAAGLNQRLMQRLTEIMTCGSGSGGGEARCSSWRVICTGHSLGGALATLASYDVATLGQQLQQQGLKVQVQAYTFGAPRPGNHAFARDFRHVVPDAWDVVHANDAVAKEGKFLILYKRAANRVLVTAQGDIMPRPSSLELSLQKGPGSSIKQHLLTCYSRSFSQVIRGQFASKATDNASRVALRQLASCKFVQDLLGNLLTMRQRTVWRMRFNPLPSDVSLVVDEPAHTLPSAIEMAEPEGPSSGDDLEADEGAGAALEEEEVEGGEGSEAGSGGEGDYHIATGQAMHRMPTRIEAREVAGRVLRTFLSARI